MPYNSKGKGSKRIVLTIEFLITYNYYKDIYYIVEYNIYLV